MGNTGVRNAEFGFQTMLGPVQIGWDGKNLDCTSTP
jgi:hypothetical protein